MVTDLEKTPRAAPPQTRRRGAKAFKTGLVILAAFTAVAAFALAAAGAVAWRAAKADGPHQQQTIVMLPSGMGVGAIAAALKDAGVIDHGRLFRAVVRLKGVESDLKAGEYAIPARANLLAVIDLLIDGKSILHYFTAPEGLTTAAILTLVEDNSILEGEVTLAPEEGSMLPETYALTRGESRDQIITRMMTAQRDLIDQLWSTRALELPYSTKEEALILASIVERETGLAEERARIASVFINRMKRGMRLESDPTIIYGLTKGIPLGRGLRQSELRKPTPYNTYVINGLPPTPIANPGADAIAAVLNPAQTDDIFFVADGQGGHAFAATLSEHNKNVARWRRIEKARKAQ